MEDKESQNKNTRKWLALINIPIQMGAIIFLFSYLGRWLDENHPNSRIYFSKLLIIVGVFVALYNVMRQVNEINKKQ